MTARKRSPKIEPTQFVEPQHVASLDLKADAERFALAARIAATFASTDDGRIVLTSIHLTSNGKGTIVFEATDSYRLVKITLKNIVTVEDTHPVEFDAVIPAKWFVRNLPARPRRIGFAIDITDASITVRDHADHTSATAPLVQGAFPNSATIWDGTTDHIEGLPEGVAFNPTYLYSLLKACEKWGGGLYASNPVHVRSLDPMKPVRFDVVSGEGELHAALMPVRVP